MRGGDPAEYQGQPAMSSREICDEFPGWQLPEELDHRGWWKSKPYENTEGAEFRAKRLALRTRQELGLTDDHVAYVFHGTFKQFFIGALFGVSVVEQSWLGDVRNSGVTRVSITPESTRLEFYNAVGHLPASLIT
jgi:broad specificity phosphatase PhoE